MLMIAIDISLRIDGYYFAFLRSSKLSLQKSFIYFNILVKAFFSLFCIARINYNSNCIFFNL